jgi:DNA (cytosine-5)-methyltransferase 1
MAFSPRSSHRLRSDGGSDNLVTALTAKMAKGTSGPAGDEHHHLVADPICANEGKNWSHAGNNPRLELDIRRLMPIECERLQGLPDDWTAGHADTVRYRLIGNGMAVPCVQWIATRLREALAGEWG